MFYCTLLCFVMMGIFLNRGLGFYGVIKRLGKGNKIFVHGNFNTSYVVIKPSNFHLLIFYYIQKT